MTAIDQDWVRDAIERHSDASGGNGRDFHNGAYAAIADEIAATLGDEGVGRSNDGVADLEAGTCHDVGRHCFTCSECGHTTNEPHHMFNRNDPNVMPNFCPNCGAKVVDDG